MAHFSVVKMNPTNGIGIRLLGTFCEPMQTHVFYHSFS
jgi:hypothetical protein